MKATFTYLVTIEGDVNHAPFPAGTLEHERQYLKEGAEKLADGACQFWQVLMDNRQVTITPTKP